jgi:excisionase family DNA binding protein
MRILQSEQMTEDRLLTADEIAKRLRVSLETVRRWLRSGELRGFRPGGTKAGWRVRESDLAEYLRDRKMERRAR